MVSMINDGRRGLAFHRPVLPRRAAVRFPRAELDKASLGDCGETGSTVGPASSRVSH
jgi:hypothetical protein